jgi:hypothetical protein
MVITPDSTRIYVDETNSSIIFGLVMILVIVLIARSFFDKIKVSKASDLEIMHMGYRIDANVDKYVLSNYNGVATYFAYFSYNNPMSGKVVKGYVSTKDNNRTIIPLKIDTKTGKKYIVVNEELKF